MVFLQLLLIPSWELSAVVEKSAGVLNRKGILPEPSLKLYFVLEL